ncbi:hypothetical protein BMS3Bbin06_01240 [bacterium BMS3Bbin06]|nr:hypothetical protein BMS3Bbin06_01240 [bacterium BMS3Bbin06]
MNLRLTKDNEIYTPSPNPSHQGSGKVRGHPSWKDGRRVATRQLSIVIPACPESKRSMIPNVAGMTIKTPRYYKVDTTVAFRHGSGFDDDSLSQVERVSSKGLRTPSEVRGVFR